MKTYEVIIEAYRVVLVEAASAQEAMAIADNDTNMGDFEHDTTSSNEISGSELADAMRHHELIKDE